MASTLTDAVTPAEAIEVLRSGMNLFIHGTPATPTPLLEALCQRTDLHDITIYHLHLCGPVPFADPEMQNRMRSVSLFTGPGLRQAVEEGRADYIPIFLSDIPHLVRSGKIRIDAMLLQLSPPDQHGHCTLGTAVEVARAAADVAPILITEINEQMPRTHGDTVLPLSRLTRFTHTNRPMHETHSEP
ncbi:MAG TPA: hypothetical protein PLX97_15655, partial [Gemmatales bacterium]|nr:hypothetical protein [Gemmatales bacterium]